MNSEERKNYWNSQVEAAERALEYAREQREKASRPLGEIAVQLTLFEDLV